VSEAGWPVSGSDREGLRVDLDVPGAFHQARVEDHHGGVRFAADIVRIEPLRTTTRPALALLLLSASALVRMARAAVERTSGEEAVRFEVVFDAAPSAAEIAHALSALSVACRGFAREAKALADEAVAMRYLELRGWSH
jgi:hypothetical protein